MADEDAEVAELKAMLASGPLSRRGAPPTHRADDFMSAHVKSLKRAAYKDRINQTLTYQSHMSADNFLMHHLRTVKEQAAPNRTWQGTASQLPADNFLSSHNKKLMEESGPKVYKSTKIYGVAPKGLKNDDFMMTHVAEIEKLKKGGISSIGMAPRVNADSYEVEFVRGQAAANQKGKTSIGHGATITADSYMNAFTKQMHEEQMKTKNTSVGGVSHMPADSYMQQHLKHVQDINHMHKHEHEKAQLSADSFMIDFHKKSRIANATRPIPHKQGNLPADSYLLAQMKEIRDMNAKAAIKDSIHERPYVNTDDFTMSVLAKAQKDVMSY